MGENSFLFMQCHRANVKFFKVGGISVQFVRYVIDPQNVLKNRYGICSAW